MFTAGSPPGVAILCRMAPSIANAAAISICRWPVKPR